MTTCPTSTVTGGTKQAKNCSCGSSQARKGKIKMGLLGGIENLDVSVWVSILCPYREQCLPYTTQCATECETEQCSYKTKPFFIGIEHTAYFLEETTETLCSHGSSQKLELSKHCEFTGCTLASLSSKLSNFSNTSRHKLFLQTVFYSEGKAAGRSVVWRRRWSRLETHLVQPLLLLLFPEQEHHLWDQLQERRTERLDSKSQMYRFLSLDWSGNWENGQVNHTSRSSLYNRSVSIGHSMKQRTQECSEYVSDLIFLAKWH